MDNSICSFEDIFKKLPKKKINIVSVCLFKIDNGYHDFSRYLNGAKRLKEFTKMIDYTLLIFIDDSIYTNKEIYDKLLENTFDDNTIYIKYNCPKFKKDENFHKGLFGTLVRFFPLFDFPNNPFKKVIISDIDFDKSSFNRMFTYFITMKKLKLDSLCKVYSSLEYSPQFFKSNKRLYRNKDDIAIMACSMFFNKKKLDYNIIVNYLNKIMDTSSELYKDMRKKTLIHEIDDVFAYGVDEYFLSNILYYIFKKYDINICYYKSFDLLHFLNVLHKQYINKTLKNVEEYKKLLQTVLHQPKNNDINKLYNIIKTILNSYKIPELSLDNSLIKATNNGANEKQLNIANNIYKYLEYLNKTKNYKLIDEKSINYILSHKGIIKCEEVFNKETNKLYRFYNTYKF